jgi:hypothetical protein
MTSTEIDEKMTLGQFIKQLTLKSLIALIVATVSAAGSVFYGGIAVGKTVIEAVKAKKEAELEASRKTVTLKLEACTAAAEGQEKLKVDYVRVRQKMSVLSCYNDFLVVFYTGNEPARAAARRRLKDVLRNYNAEVVYEQSITKSMSVAKSTAIQVQPIIMVRDLELALPSAAADYLQEE